MPEIGDFALGQAIEIQPLPPFADPRDILADALPLLDAASRIAPVEVASRHLRVETRGVWQNYDPDVTPYMVEPVNASVSRLYKGGAFVGPSQAGKTMALITTALHPVLTDPAPVLVVHMDRPSRDRWVEESLNPVIYNSPEVLDRLGKARDDDTFSRKRFRGMRLALGYPTPQWLSSAKYRLVCLTDYDHFPPELGVRKDAPEGSAYDMAGARVRTFMSRGFVMAESTPAWPVSDLAWSPSPYEPHAFPPVEFGIVKLFNKGTRGRWYWECRDCGELYEPEFAKLHFDAAKPAMQAGEGAEMECPHCHSLIGPQHRNEMNRAAARGHGGWLHETEGETTELVPLGDPAIRQSEIASWALDGAAATFSNWAELVARGVEARREAEKLGDEQGLARFTYTDLGKPYARAVDNDDDALSLQFLKDHLQEAKKGVAPDWTRFVTVSVDVQGTWFPVQITAWGENGQSQIVDRFDLTQPPKDAPNAAQDGDTRKLDPARYIEDWDVLKPLADRIVPVANSDHGLTPLVVVVDFHGKPGVSDNAELFIRGRKAEGQGTLWRASRGQGGWKTPFRVKYERPERGHGGKAARSIKLLTIATDRLKDTVAASLKRASGGAGAMWMPYWMRDDAEMLGEYVAEERLKDGWEKKAGQVRNEGIDLCVMARAGAEHQGLLRVDWTNPPPWAVGGPENTHAVSLTATAAAEPQPETAKPTAPRRINYLKRG